MNSYPEDWQEIALRIMEAAEWKCEHCGRVDDLDSGHVLTIHHLDMDKGNCEDDNLVALCQHCHLHWQARFLPGQLMMPFAIPEWLDRRGHARAPASDEKQGGQT